MREKFFRPTWTEINLAALEFNYRQVRRLVGKDVKILCVVKADAYGHGMLAVAKRLKRNRVDYLGVASIDEAVVLRKSKIRQPILILENSLDRFARYIVDYNLIQCISDFEYLREQGRSF